jgi:hypothetical protein
MCVPLLHIVCSQDWLELAEYIVFLPPFFVCLSAFSVLFQVLFSALISRLFGLSAFFKSRDSDLLPFRLFCLFALKKAEKARKGQLAKLLMIAVFDFFLELAYIPADF